MPNWCSNTLTISCSKKHKEELKLFKVTASAKGIVKKSNLEKKRKSWLKVHEKQYKDELRLTEWVEHHTMPVKDFFLNILSCKEGRRGNMLMCDSDLSMQYILPCPAELLNVTSPVRAENDENKKQFAQRVERHKSQYGHEDWYSWKIANWGTKWDVDASLEDESETQLQYQFNSAWSPPVKFIQTVSKKFPNLKFKLEYDESGECFRGTATAENGEVEDVCENYVPTCGNCGEEYDENGECPCDKEQKELEVKVKNKIKKRNK